MSVLFAIIEGLGALVGTLAALLLVYIAYASLAYRDIPVSRLEQWYGDNSLQVARLDGIDLRYRLQGSGPTVVLIHSHFFDMRLWDAWMPELTRHFQVLRYDLPGHGLTGPDAHGLYSVDRDVGVLEQLLDRLHIQHASLVGTSLGGNSAFTYAARHPGQVDSLVLINSGGLPRGDSRQRGGIPAWADLLMPLIPRWALNRFLDWMLSDRSVLTDGFRQRFFDLWRREGNRRAELARLRQYQTGNPDPLLAAITAPTLILWGRNNPQLPPEMAASFAARLSSAAVVETHLYDAGHLLPLERPQETVNQTITFLKAHTPSLAQQRRAS